MSKTQKVYENPLFGVALVHQDRQTDNHYKDKSCVSLPLPNGLETFLFAGTLEKLKATISLVISLHPSFGTV
jgi:hypothetical protein